MLELQRENREVSCRLVQGGVRHPEAFSGLGTQDRAMLFCVSAFVKSQAATLTIMLPFGLALGLPVPLLLGLVPASYAYFFFCFYPSDLAAINMDRTGTTRIGKYLLNPSFMMPGLVGVGVSTVVAYLISRVAF
jgi:anaerobic C4-dicarboxylate transporter DcuB